MKLFTIALLLTTQVAFAQKEKLISLYAGLNNSYTLNDLTRQNNPFALGAFISGYANTGGWLRPAIEVTGDAFVFGDDIKFENGADGVHPNLDAMLNLMFGAAIQFERFLSIGCVTGPSFVSSPSTYQFRKSAWAVKPTIDITPGKGKLSIRLGYLKTTARDEFAYLRRYKAVTLGVGVRLL